MPGIDGLELIRRIRAADSTTSTILLSGLLGCMGLTEQTSGADELILKSSKEVPELLRALRKLSSRPGRRKPASVKRAVDGSGARRAS
jgi:CheY-like chemotaxis protein